MTSCDRRNCAVFCSYLQISRNGPEFHNKIMLSLRTPMKKYGVRQMIVNHRFSSFFLFF